MARGLLTNYLRAIGVLFANHSRLYMEKSKEILWHHLPLEKIFETVKSNQNGLDEEEAKKRLEKYGFNELPKKKRLARLEIFFNQFKNVLVYILLIAGGISWLFGEDLDPYVIFFALVINVLVGYVQENKARDALEKLRQFVVLKAKAIRDGEEEEIEAKYLAPGDIVILEAGDKVPADARIISCSEFEVMEAVLTGESAPINKEAADLEKGMVLAERRNMVYQGTQVIKGRARTVVAATGKNTQFGRIAGLLKEMEDDITPLQKKLNIFSKNLGIIILLLSLMIFVLGIISGQSFLVMFNTAVAVAVSAIPEGLAVAVTVILALGMRNILKQQALVRKLVAAETLGSTTVLCVDKTGTITKGEMSVTRIVTDSYQIDVSLNPLQITNSGVKEGWQLLKICALCNNAVIKNESQELKDWQILGSSTEKALLLAAAQVGIKRKELDKESPRFDELVFSPLRKYMATINHYDGKKNIMLIKGAPEYLLSASNYTLVGERPIKIYSDKRKDLNQKLASLSAEGLRILGVGYKFIDSNIKKFENLPKVLDDLVFIGFVGIKDPLRPDVKETLAATKKAGLKTIIITGDNKITASAIAKELGLENSEAEVLDGRQLMQMNDEELFHQVKNIKIYARVMPQDKLRIVEAWQKHGEVVAMMGDGINDAPALKRADIGVAPSSGTEVAQETADMVLLNNSFSTLVKAVEQGRVIYENIKKVVLYLLSDSFSEVIIVIGSIAFNLPLPLLPAQILWINLISDGFPSLALTAEPSEKEIMSEPPQEREKPILDGERKWLIVIISSVTAIFSLAIFYYYMKVIGNLTLARSMVFAALGVYSSIYVFSCRSLKRSIFRINIFNNLYLLAAVALGIAFQVVAIYAPFLQKALHTTALSLKEWGFILATCVLVILVIEVTKRIFLARHSEKKML